MILHLLRMRRNVNRNVFNDRKFFCATTCRRHDLGNVRHNIKSQETSHRNESHREEKDTTLNVVCIQMYN